MSGFLIAFVILTIITIFWVVYVASNMFCIVLSGLFPVFCIWIIHLMVTILTLFVCFVRAPWNQDEPDFIFKTPLLCVAMGFYLHNMTAFMGLLTTIFGFTKVKIYLTLTDSTFCMQISYRLLRVALFFYGVAVLARMLSTDAGPLIFEGIHLCSNPHADAFQQCTMLTIMFLFIFLNSSFIRIFFKFRNLQHDSIPELSSQMKTNLYIIPFIFFTTVILALLTLTFTAVTTSEGTDDYSPTYFIYTSIIDNLLNNMAMYWNIFGKFRTGTHDFFDNSRLFFNESRDIHSVEMSWSNNAVVFSDAQHLPPYVWISLPGAHPLRVKNTVVVENDLEEYIIFEKRRLKQIRRYRRRGFVSSLLCCCDSLEEVMSELDRMGPMDVEETQTQHDQHHYTHGLME